jgi:hypothetical protein
MEATFSFETSFGFQRVTWSYIREDKTRQEHSCTRFAGLLLMILSEQDLPQQKLPKKRTKNKRVYFRMLKRRL